MPTSQNHTFISDADLEELSRRGEAIYEQKLKAQLEPEHNNRYVAIHVDTEDYAVGRTFREAKQTILKRHPMDGKLVVMKIGSEPEYSLAARLLLRNSIHVA